MNAAGLRPLAGLLLFAGPSLLAQEWRTIESSRQLRGDAPATVRVEYAAGTFDLSGTDDPVLYRMKLRYDARRSTPVAGFDDATRTVTLGTRGLSSGTWHRDTRKGSTLRAEITRTAPIRLTCALGATRGDLALGGLRITEFTLKAGASETHVDFATPNPESSAVVDIDVGAASVSVRRGGNARASRIHANVGAGTLDYDLAGDWTGDVAVSANVAVGSMRLRVPADAGVRVRARTFIADFGRAGLEKRGDAWVSPGFDSAARRIRVDVTVALGGFEVVRR